MSKKVLLCGVGGQGTILAAHVLAKTALLSGQSVKVSEIHGMSQRGGAVVTDVIFGEDVESMVCDKGSADIVVSFEMIEAMRNLPMLKLNAKLLVSDEVIKPSSVLTGKSAMPNDLRGRLLNEDALLVPAEATANEIGNKKTSNVVMLGALSALLEFDEDVWKEAISEFVPTKTIDINLEAFEAGRAFVLEKE